MGVVADINEVHDFVLGELTRSSHFEKINAKRPRGNHSTLRARKKQNLVAAGETLDFKLMMHTDTMRLKELERELREASDEKVATMHVLYKDGAHFFRAAKDIRSLRSYPEDMIDNLVVLNGMERKLRGMMGHGVVYYDPISRTLQLVNFADRTGSYRGRGAESRVYRDLLRTKSPVSTKNFSRFAVRPYSSFTNGGYLVARPDYF